VGAETSRHDEKAIAFFGTWMNVGLYLDGWAHMNQKPESFFTPWHGVLYSGFGAAVAWFFVHDYVRPRKEKADRIAVAGFLIFMLGALGDFAWHTIFGIEVDLAALLSPTHLTLLIGGVMMVSLPVRLAWHRSNERDTGLRAFMPQILSFTLIGSVALFFTQYFNALGFQGLFQSPKNIHDYFEVHALGSVFIANAIMLGVTLLAVRRWNTPFGMFAIVYGGFALGVTGLRGFEAFPNVVAAVLSGFLVDLLVRRLRPAPGRVREARIFSALVPVLIWGPWFISLQLQYGVHWPAELPPGTVVLAALEGFGMGLLAFPPGERTSELQQIRQGGRADDHKLA
jgi:hypothetical protein